jgi:hypothetical protein
MVQGIPWNAGSDSTGQEICAFIEPQVSLVRQQR